MEGQLVNKSGNKQAGMPIKKKKKKKMKKKKKKKISLNRPF
jgi:hypothetical protein